MSSLLGKTIQGQGSFDLIFELVKMNVVTYHTDMSYSVCR